MKVSNFKLRCTSFFFLFISFYGFSQTVSGIFKDEKTEETIPYATVSIGENYGVITNDEGKFQINISGFSENDSLIFSSMGYEKHQIAIKDFNSETVYLAESLNELDNVYIIDRDLDPVEIMEKVNERLAENYETDMTQFTLFQRIKETSKISDYSFELKKATFFNRKDVKKFNFTLDSLSKKTKGSSFTTYDDQLIEFVIGSNDSIKRSLKKGTRLLNRDKSFNMEDLTNNLVKILGEKLRNANTFKLKTGIFKAEDSMDFHQKERKDTIILPSYFSFMTQDLMKQNGFGENSDLEFVTKPNRYDYKLVNVTDFNNEVVYVLDFEPDGWSGKYEGELYVSAETFAVVRADYALAEGEKIHNINLKFILGVHFQEDQKSGSVIYAKNDNNKYVPKYIKIQGRENIDLERPFKLKENNPDRSERIKIKFDLHAHLLDSHEIEMLFVENKSISETEFSEFKSRWGKIEIIEKYDPKIWEDYNIIAPTQAIKEFEF